MGRKPGKISRLEQGVATVSLVQVDVLDSIIKTNKIDLWQDAQQIHKYSSQPLAAFVIGSFCLLFLVFLIVSLVLGCRRRKRLWELKKSLFMAHGALSFEDELLREVGLS